MKIGIVIPAYNAQATLAGVVARIPAEIDSQLAAIWIVDDASRDRTRQLAVDLAAQRPIISVIEHAENRGYGGAMKSGLRAAALAEVDVVATLHADGQYAPERLPGLLDVMRARRLDILQGSRLAGGRALQGGMPLYKFVAGRLLTWGENRLFRLALSDYHSGYLLFARRALSAIRFDRLSDSFDFDLEMIASGRAAGLAIGEAPIPTHYGDEVSYLNPVTYGLRVLRIMARYAAGRYGRGLACEPATGRWHSPLQ